MTFVVLLVVVDIFDTRLSVYLFAVVVLLVGYLLRLYPSGLVVWFVWFGSLFLRIPDYPRYLFFSFGVSPIPGTLIWNRIGEKSAETI